MTPRGSRLIGVFLCLLSVSACAAPHEEIPVITIEKDEYILALPDRMQQAIKAHEPEFRAWRQDDYVPALITLYTFRTNQAPFAAIGDFNSDEVLDLAIHGRNRQHNLILCVLSTGKGFTVKEILRTPLGPLGERQGTYLTLVPPGKIHIRWKRSPVELKTEAFEVHHFEKASILYYFSDGEFLRYATAG